jgi:hypothetical protein
MVTGWYWNAWKHTVGFGFWFAKVVGKKEESKG